MMKMWLIACVLLASCEKRSTVTWAPSHIKIIFAPSGSLSSGKDEIGEYFDVEHGIRCYRTENYGRTSVALSCLYVPSKNQ